MPHKHGHRPDGKPSPTYRSWAAMKQRCLNPNNPDFRHYGGRGITVCDRWRSFENFLADMGIRPAGLELDREDNDRGYDPTNCRWATRQEQNRNQRDNVVVVFRGEEMILAEAIRRSGISQSLFEHRRYSAKWSIDRALHQPKRKHIRSKP